MLTTCDLFVSFPDRSLVSQQLRERRRRAPRNYILLVPLVVLPWAALLVYGRDQSNRSWSHYTTLGGAGTDMDKSRRLDSWLLLEAKSSRLYGSHEPTRAQIIMPSTHSPRASRAES